MGVRTDIGCADSKVYDRETQWDPNARTFFLNEIEYGGTTYFPRVLKFDCIPLYAKLYASKALEIQRKMAAPVKVKPLGLPVSLSDASRASTADTLGDLSSRSFSESEDIIAPVEPDMMLEAPTTKEVVMCRETIFPPLLSTPRGNLRAGKKCKETINDDMGVA